MEERGAVNASGRRVEPESEVTLAAPRFDQKSVQRAQPAVPLAARVRRPARPTSLVVICLVAALAGAFVGVLALTLYQRDSRGARVADAHAARALEPASPAAGPEAPRADGAAPVAEAEGPAGAETLKAADVSEETKGGEPEGEGSEGDAAAEGDAAPAGEAPASAGDAEAVLRGALGAWVEATNARDIRRQMSFYDRRVGSFYLARNVSRDAVRAEKSRVFSSASAVEVSAGRPDITLGPDGRTAVMRFRKRYRIESGEQSRRGEVLQELRWRRTAQGWKIVGERDLRVLQ
jgi:SnoaL-like domain